MSSENSLAKKAAIAVAVGAGAVGAYLVYRKLRASSSSASGSSPLTEEEINLTVEQIKQLGNKLFSAKKYDEAIFAFTRAIDKEDEEDTEILRSQCYQNRAAAKERVGKYSPSDMLQDVTEALKLNPAYGKAWFRKSRLHEKMKQYFESLVDVLIAMSLDSTYDQQSAQLMLTLITELEKVEAKKWQDTFVQGQPKLIRHERVYSWLYKTVKNDVLKKEVIEFNGESSGYHTYLTTLSPYHQAIKLIQDFKYDEVAEKALGEDIGSEKRLNALLIAARFFAYGNKKDEFKRTIEEFDGLFNSLIELETDAKKDLIASKHVLLIDVANTKDDIMKAFYNAIATDLKNPDFYAMAAFRLVLVSEASEAMKLLMTEGIKDEVNIKLLSSTLQILANTEATIAASSLHNAVYDLEKFVNELEPKTNYSQTLLAKVYATFGNIEQARELMDNILEANPNVSIHYYDRSCMVESADEALQYLKKCLDIEPKHAEALVMMVSLRMNESPMKLISKSEYESLTELLDRAQATFDNTIDFPTVSSVFKLRAVLDAKKQAALTLGGFH